MVTDTKPYIDPKEYFHPEDNRIPPDHGGFVMKYGPYVFAVFGSSLGIVAGNFYHKKPIFSGPLKFLALGAASVYGFNLYRDYHHEKTKRLNYFVYNYIRDHPDEFPLIERKKFATLFEPWRPCR